MSTTQTPEGAKNHTPIGRVIAIAIGMTAIIAANLLAFSWPALTAEPHDVPVAVAGPEEAVSAIETQLAENGDGVFDVTAVSDREAAVAGIEARDFVGAIVLGPEPELLTASASGTVNQVVTQLEAPLTQALNAQAQTMAEASGQPAAEVQLAVTDVAPFSNDDPNGALLSSAFFPMLFGGIIGGVLLSNVITGSFRRILGLAVYSAAGGIVLASILQGWFGSIQGDYWINAGIFAMAIAAIAAPMIGFVALIGRAGMAVGPVVMMLFANPISGTQLPSQFLPGVWGQIGQWFPPGAAATLVRDQSYFPNADTLAPWLILTAWVVGGIVIALLGHFRTSNSNTEAAVRSRTDQAQELTAA